MPKLYFALQSQAQTRADSLHTSIIAGNPAYAGSVSANQTLRWAIPRQDVDLAGTPLNVFWWITCRDRCMPYVTGPEVALLVSEDIVPSVLPT